MAKESGLTPTEFKILAAAWISCESPPKPDYKKVAEICGYKNANSAATIFSNVKKKLLANSSNGGGDATKETSTPKSNNKNKRAATDDPEELDSASKKRGRKSQATGDGGVTCDAGNEVKADKKAKSEGKDDGKVKPEPVDDLVDPGFFTSAAAYLTGQDSDT